MGVCIASGVVLVVTQVPEVQLSLTSAVIYRSVFRQPRAYVYIVSTAIFVPTWMTVMVPRFKARHPAVYLLLCSSIASVTVVASRAFSSILTDAMAAGEYFTLLDWVPIISLIIIVIVRHVDHPPTAWRVPYSIETPAALRADRRLVHSLPAEGDGDLPGERASLPGPARQLFVLPPFECTGGNRHGPSTEQPGGPCVLRHVYPRLCVCGRHRLPGIRLHGTEPAAALHGRLPDHLRWGLSYCIEGWFPASSPA